MNILLFLFIALGSVSSFASQPSSKAKDSHAHSDESDHDHDEESTEHKDDEKHAHSEDEESHDHKSGSADAHKDEHAHEADEGDKHEDEHAHGEGEHAEEGEGGHEEENSAIGPGKGITEKSENGFKLSEKAMKNFNITTVAVASGNMEFARSALVEIKDKKFVYRIRNGWIKKIPVRVLSKTKSKVILEISESQSTDLIITGGNGFVRTAEIITEEGVSHGHSH